MDDYKKKYENLIEQLKKAKEEYGEYTFSSIINEIVPEFKESEDEKIRKAIIEEFKVKSIGGNRNKFFRNGVTYNDAIAWLEKKGEQNNLLNFDEAEKEKNDFVSGQFVECRKSFNEFKEFESYWFEYVGDDTYIGRSDNILNQRFHITPRQLFTLFTHEHCPKDNENQCEQKSVDADEPKFKVGNWIVIQETAYQITKAENLNVTLSLNGRECLFDIGILKNAHLWTIEDAKDGDVLAEDSCMFIIEKMKSEEMAIVYCCLFDDGDFDLTGSTLYFDVDSTYPATKEQRDLLFQKMHEAGYEWNAEKKELKKINSYCQENCKGFQETGKCFADGECKAKREAEQKSSWSEEDEKMLLKLEKHFDWNDSEYRFTKDDCDKALDWLKSIKPNNWKPSEEQMEALAIAVHDAHGRSYYEKLFSIYNYLKKL